MGSFLPDRFEAMILGKMPFARGKRASDRFGRNGLAAINGTAWVDFGHRIFQLDLSFRLRSRDFAKQSADATIFPRRLKVGRAAVLGSIPFDALWNVMSATFAGGFRFIYLHGAAMKNGTARINSIGFYQEFDLEDA